MNENLETIDNESINNNGLVINNQMRQDLLTSAKWGKFLAIIGFIFLGLSVLGFISRIALSGGRMEMSGGFIFIFILMIALYFFPSYLLLLYSNKIKDAIENTSNLSLQEGFSNLAKLYKFVGILTIIILVLYVLFIIYLITMIGSRGF